jgi:hypothetical protein
MNNSNNIELKPSLLDTAVDNSNEAKIKLLNHKIKLNYFPNDQTKHIDYVIYYKDGPDADKDSELKRIRDKFIKQLIEKEDFDVEKIVKNKDKSSNKKSIYLLLNCSLVRLMEEVSLSFFYSLVYLIFKLRLNE